MTVLEAAFKPGVNVPGFAKTLVRAGRFVKIVDTKTADGAYQVGECGLGDRAFGVSEVDSGPTTQPAHSVERMVNICRSGSIARVVPGGNIAYGDLIQSDAQGRAIVVASAVAAALDTGVVGSNNAITWTARAAGAAGNSITVTLVDPGGTTAALSVDVANNGLDIIVSLGRAASALVSTAQNVIDAIQANGAANALVSVANKSTSTGSGIVAAVAKTNLAGGSDPEGGASVVAQAVETKASTAAFVEVAIL